MSGPFYYSPLQVLPLHEQNVMAALQIRIFPLEIGKLNDYPLFLQDCKMHLMHEEHGFKLKHWVWRPKR